MNEADSRLVLATRLRRLREEHWSGRRITQTQLAFALGVSVPLISSWEKLSNPRVPPLVRVDAYARLFATPRSFDLDESGALRAVDLSHEEQRTMADLKSELRHLRSAALQAAAEPDSDRGPVSRSLSAGPWHFPDGGRITIVCAQLPQQMLDQIPYTRVDDPDYIDLLTFSELDSLFELHGHIRAANPGSDVFLRKAGSLKPDDFQTHLAVLGGIDWNSVTEEVLERLDLPVRQVAHWDTEDAQYFEVDESGITKQHRPVLSKSGNQAILHEDVALFARAVNPFNRKRTVTICNGMYGRGTYGAVRALTDSEFREDNAGFIESRFGDCDSYCILTRVTIVHGETLTPDWTAGSHTLFEWSR